MKPLHPPIFDAAFAVNTCAQGITIPERAQALLDALPVIQVSEVEYRELGALGNLFMIAGSTHVTPDINSELMGVIYKSHFVRSGSPTRPLYEQIRFAPKYGICPLCSQRSVATVDHYLPQSQHPRLNLTPVNLVPSCTDCNKKKLASVAVKAEDQTLHPYFDDLGTDRWLIAHIQATSPLAIIFTVRPSQSWSATLAERVRHHFNLFGLGELYVAQAASELADISVSLLEIENAEVIRQHLESEYRSRRARDANSWKTALYEGLKDSDWFCNEGYKLIE